MGIIMTASTALLIMFILCLKHYLVDYVLQTPTHKAIKNLNDPAKIVHSIQNGILTFLLLTVILGGIKPAIVIVSVLDMTTHHAIDLCKVTYVDPWLLRQGNRIYDNMANGFDDTLHYMIYILIVFICI